MDRVVVLYRQISAWSHPTDVLWRWSKVKEQIVKLPVQDKGHLQLFTARVAPCISDGSIVVVEC